MDVLECNYNSEVTIDDRTRTFPRYIDSTANDYLPTAFCDDGICESLSCRGCPQYLHLETYQFYIRFLFTKRIISTKKFELAPIEVLNAFLVHD